ncbi:hypothetical protein CK203_078989 [Vitis vinifera]|uniref:Uncharacterized protein n=1 Tax=Vitis vinifera TaxID=29760 RepID=A0A438DA68_VITVI|nr:hypothetical protein CK203_078989 [Vitis vinifera]
MPSLQDIESMMVGIDDMEEFKRVFLIFACATLLAPTSRLEAIHEHRRKESVWIKGCLMFLQIFYFSISNFPAMYVELNIPRIAAWNDFLVKQRIKLELEMLGGFDKVEVICARIEATQHQITDAQSHLNSLIASYNRDVKVLRTRFTSSHYRTDEGQPSNCHEHVNESGVSEIPNVEDGVFFANKDPLHPGPHNMLVLVQLCMDNSADVVPQASEEIRPQRVKIKVRRHRQQATACKSHFVQLCVSKYKRLTEEETHVADYVFDESKDPNEMLCAYGGYGVTREQLQCLVGESFIDIPVISMFCQYMNAKEENPSRIHFFNPYFGEICGFNEQVYLKINTQKRLGSYCVNLECCNQLLKNSFKQNDVNINNLHPQYADIVGHPKLCHTRMYVILYMQHWDGSGLDRTVNSERMSLERLKFSNHMVLDSENEIGEMVTANIWSTNNA